MRYLPLLVLSLISLFHDSLAQQAVPSAGKIIRLAPIDASPLTARHIDVWLPANFDSSRTYRSLYMHDGQMLFDANTTWNKQEWGVDESLQALIDASKVDNTIVIAIWNDPKTRWIDYMPESVFNQLPKAFRDSLFEFGIGHYGIPADAEIRSDEYLEFMVVNVIPAIEKQFPVSKKAQDRFIMGSSMGGLISYYAITQYPNIFGGAACLSTHWPGIFTLENNPIPDAFADYTVQNISKLDNHILYFDYGTATLDSLYEPLQKRIDAAVLDNKTKDLIYKSEKFEGASHSENAWRERLPQILTFLLKTEP